MANRRFRNQQLAFALVLQALSHTGTKENLPVIAIQASYLAGDP
jgi:hypothetical protein